MASRSSDFQHLSRSKYSPRPIQSPCARYANITPSLMLSLSHTDGSVSVNEPGRFDVKDDTELDSALPSVCLAQVQAQTLAQISSSHKATTAGPTIRLPTHDGLGTFQLETKGHGHTFEQCNLQGATERQRESFSLAQIENHGGTGLAKDSELTQRIDAWRREHNMVLLEEIQKRTRCQREPNARQGWSRPVSGTEVTAEDAVTGGAGSEGANEGLWSRIMWKLILDVMGFDDRILSILFGETFVGDEDWREEIDLLSAPGSSDSVLAAMDIAVDDWDDGSPSSPCWGV